MGFSCDKNKPITDLEKAKISSYLKLFCEDPTKVPKRVLKRIEVIELWNTDRKRLRACANRHKALVDAVNLIEGGKIK